jgi:non-specific protein-tyrosine kinase
MITNFIFPILRRWLWLLILVTLLTAGIGYLASQNQTITYDSDVRLLVGPGLTNSSPDLNDLRASGQLLETYASLVTTHPFLQDIVDQLHLDITANKLGNNLDVKTTAASQILDIRVTDTDPERAMLIANTIAAHIIAISPFNPESAEFKLQDQVNKQITRIEERIAQGEDAITQYNALLATAPTGDKVSILSQISQERSRLSSSEQVLLGLYETLQKPNTNQVTVIDPAVTGKPTNPQLQLRVITGALAGIVLTLPIILAFEFFRGNIKRVEDIANVPILGSIYTYPHFKEGGANALIGYRVPEASVAEAYRKLASEILLTDDGIVPSSV